VKKPVHPHWDRILSHIFDPLDDAVKRNESCRQAGIAKGVQWGTAWLASAIRHPFEPLPFLCLVGDQNAGKSILHEALATLFVGGIANVKLALTEKYNGVFQGCVFAVVDEKNLAQCRGIYDLLKELTTAKTILVRYMRTDAYHIPNTLHFIYCTNHLHYLPLDPRDTRITVVEVPPLEKKIGKKRLLADLSKEASHFLTTLMQFPLPELDDRMMVPVLDTDIKQKLAYENEPVAQFLDEKLELDPDAITVKKAVHECYQHWALQNEVEPVGPRQFGRRLIELSGRKIIPDSDTQRNYKGKKCDTYRGVKFKANQERCDHA
jgi:phage/plasmid-associated DNA primase